jgi:exodeoxyribonuclease V alpha subunit
MNRYSRRVVLQDNLRAIRNQQYHRRLEAAEAAIEDTEAKAGEGAAMEDLGQEADGKLPPQSENDVDAPGDTPPPPASLAIAIPRHHAADWPDPADIPDFSEHQREEYAKACGTEGGSLRLICGRPGVGKSFCLARILKAIPQCRAAVCSPTGKASVRITELMQQAGVNMRATTIHSLLKVASSEDGWKFEHDEENPLPLDYIFIDEFSMCDVEITGSLLSAKGPGCKVLAFGDVNQLSPVGPGAPLRDLIALGIPCGNMIQVRRNAGRIVRACHEIIDAKTFTPSGKLDLEAESPENLIHVERRDPEEQIATLKAMLEKFRGGAKLLGKPISATWGVQILCPINDKGPLARIKLNQILQAHLNPSGEQIDGCPFRVGDKICCTANGWAPIEPNIPPKIEGGPFNEDQRDNRVYTANGELAKVLALFPRYTVAQLWSPDRIIRIPRGESYVNEEGEDESASVKWCLAYALSFHRSQGSEWPVVICMVDEYPGARMLATREFWYTGISRAKVMAVTLGKREVIESSIRRSGLWTRKTMLREKIADLRVESIGSQWANELSQLTL